MKKVLVLLTGFLFLQACHNDQGGVVNDGNKVIIDDSTKTNNQPVQNPDTSKMRDREDIQQRDTAHAVKNK